MPRPRKIPKALQKAMDEYKKRYKIPKMTHKQAEKKLNINYKAILSDMIIILEKLSQLLYQDFYQLNDYDQIKLKEFMKYKRKLDKYRKLKKQYEDLTGVV